MVFIQEQPSVVKVFYFCSSHRQQLLASSLLAPSASPLFLFDGQLLFSHPLLPLHPFLWPALWGSYNQTVGSGELGGGREPWEAFQEQRYTVQKIV